MSAFILGIIPYLFQLQMNPVLVQPLLVSPTSKRTTTTKSDKFKDILQTTMVQKKDFNKETTMTFHITQTAES